MEVYIESNLLHSAVCLEAGILIDTFSPVREDFLTGKKPSYFGDQDVNNPEPRKIKGLRWWIIGLVCLATIINYIDRSALADHVARHFQRPGNGQERLRADP